MFHNFKSCKYLLLALDESCDVRQWIVENFGTFCLKEHPNLWRNVNSLPRNSNLWQVLFLTFFFTCQRISARHRKISFYRKNETSSYVKSKDQKYWNFKARECCFPHCFVPLSDNYWKYLCCFPKQTLMGHEYRC